VKLVSLAGAVSTRKLAAGLMLGLGAAGFVLLLGRVGWLETLELKTYDWRMRRSVTRPPSVNPDIVLVEINDTTIRDLAPAFGRWPWPRVAFSNIINFLVRAPARVIALDLSFLEEQRHVTFKIGGDEGQTWTGDESDAALAAAVKAAGNVVLLADAVYMGHTGQEQANKPAEWMGEPFRLGHAIEERPLIIPPYQKLTDSARGLGHNFFALDPDGPVRRVAPFVRTGEKYMPSLGLITAFVAAGIKPDEVVLQSRSIRVRDRDIPLVAVSVAADAQHPDRLHDQLTMLIDYRAPALVNGERPYRAFEARHLMVSEDLLLNGEKPLVDPVEFKDKIVFVGLTTSGLVDVFQTPFGSEGTMPGIQVHASIADSLLSNHFLSTSTMRTAVGVTLTAATLVGLLSALLPFIGAALGALVLLSAWTWYAAVAFRGGLWVPMAQPLLAMSLALFAGTAYQYFVEDREKRKVKRLFGRYVSKHVYEQLLNDPTRAELGGARREMSVLFSDIRGFTSVTERGDPEELVAQLNEYFSKMVEVVFRNHGTVDKFVGDMVMALFGAPLDDVHHAEHAVRAAIDMVKELGALNQKWAAAGRAQLDIGIGISSGDMIAGNIGSASIMSYTVIGDNVNLGSRLESLNKEYRTRIIISGATRLKITSQYDIRPLGDVVVKGKTRAVAIFEVKVPSPIPVTHEEAKL
jgi:adenylate cyclase